VPLSVREETGQEASPIERPGSIPIRLKLPGGSGDLRPTGSAEVERAVLAPRLHHDFLLSEDDGLVCKPQRKAGSPTASAKAYAHPQHSPAGTFWALSATCPEVTWRGSYLEVRTGVRTPRSIPPYRGEALGRWREFNPRAGPSSFVRSAAAALTIAGPRRIIS
jgi:hypothetical protein